MELSGHYIFNFDQHAVWDRLMNPDAIAQAIPGVREMIPVAGEANTYRAVAKPGLVALSGVTSGIIRLSDLDAPHQYRLAVAGDGQESPVNAAALIKLTPLEDDPTRTRVDWTAQVTLAGKLAGAGSSLIPVTISVVSRQFFTALAKQLEHNAAE